MRARILMPSWTWATDISRLHARWQYRDDADGLVGADGAWERGWRVALTHAYGLRHRQSQDCPELTSRVPSDRFLRPTKRASRRSRGTASCMYCDRTMHKQSWAFAPPLCTDSRAIVPSFGECAMRTSLCTCCAWRVWRFCCARARENTVI